MPADPSVTLNIFPCDRSKLVEPFTVPKLTTPSLYPFVDKVCPVAEIDDTFACPDIVMDDNEADPVT